MEHFSPVAFFTMTNSISYCRFKHFIMETLTLNFDLSLYNSVYKQLIFSVKLEQMLKGLSDQIAGLNLVQVCSTFVQLSFHIRNYANEPTLILIAFAHPALYSKGIHVLHLPCNTTFHIVPKGVSLVEYACKK